MTTKKPADKSKRSSAKSATAAGSTTSAHSTVSGPAETDGLSAGDALAAKMEGTQALAAAMPVNPTKADEYGRAARDPQPGATVEPPDVAVTGSTLTESIPSAKVGNQPNLGKSPGSLPLDRVRTDASGQRLTTNQGVPVADNQNSLKAGLRGPALLEDFIL
ncbi:MAG TPA: catalase HPII, partial [Polyangiaceae bacterium]|nr:catalase HPII [Polyangiaceae bacterium]